MTSKGKIEKIQTNSTYGRIGLNTSSKMPTELIAVMFTDSRGFVCRNCIEDDENIDNENICTAILDHDDWFTGEICTRCKKLVNSGG